MFIYRALIETEGQLLSVFSFLDSGLWTLDPVTQATNLAYIISDSAHSGLSVTQATNIVQCLLNSARFLCISKFLKIYTTNEC